MICGSCKESCLNSLLTTRKQSLDLESILRLREHSGIIGRFKKKGKVPFRGFPNMRFLLPFCPLVGR